MNKRLGCWALSLLLAVAMLAAVPFAQGATVLRIGAGGDFPTVGEAFASLGENTGDLTLLLSEDLGETGDLVVPADRGITSLTLDSGDGQNHTLGAYRFFANGVPLTVDRVKVRYLYGGGLDRTVPSTKVTVRGGSIGWLMGGGTADQPGGEARVTGQAAVTFDHADTVFHSDDYLWGGGYANVQGADVSVGSVKIEILDTDLPEREIMGGGMASDRNCNADAGQVSITIRGSTLHGDVYGGGHCDTATASARSQNTSVTIVDSDFPLYNGDYGGNILGGGFLFNGGGSVDISGTAKLDIRNSTITAAIGGPLGLSSKSASAGNTSVTLQHCTVRQLVSGGCYSGDGIAAVQCENADVRIVDGITFPDGGAIYAQGYVEEKGTAVATGRASLSIEGAAVSVDAISGVTDLTLSAPLTVGQSWEPAPSGAATVTLKGGWTDGDAAITYQGDAPQQGWFAFTEEGPADYRPGGEAIWAVHAPDRHLTAQVVGEGTLSPAGAQTVGWNQSITYTAQPADGWALQSVTAGGEPVPFEGDRFSLSQLRADTQLVVTFAKQPLDLKDTGTEVQLYCPPAAIPEGVSPSAVTLQAERLQEGAGDWQLVQSALDEVAEQYTAFDISLLCDGSKIQPSGKVSVRIPIPDGYDADRLVVYRVEPTGARVPYPVEVKDGFACFETDHFSYYVLAQKAEETPPAEGALLFEQPTNGRLTAAADGQPVESGVSLPEGTVVLFTALPAAGYQLESWQLDGQTLAGEGGLQLRVTVGKEGARVAVTFQAREQQPTPTPTPPTPSAGGGSPYTGDSTPLPLLTALLLAGGTAAVLRRRRQ